MTEGARPITVLVIGDEGPVREGVPIALTSGDRFEVRTATDAASAEDLLDAVDCVVAAYELPDADGLALLEAVRADRPTVPFVLLAADGGETVASDAIAAGATDYWPELPDEPVIRERIAEAVSTARDRAATQRMAERVELALSATDSGLWEWDLETDEVIWDEHLKGLLGIEPGAFDGTYAAHTQYVHPDDLPLVETSAAAAMAGDGEFHEEFRMVREDGEVIWVEGHGKRFTSDGTDRMVGLTTDITARKDDQRALEESEERYRQLLTTAPTPIIVYTAEGEVRYVNEPAVAFLGAADRTELLGRNVRDFAHPDSAAVVEDRLARVIEDREPVPPVQETLLDVHGDPVRAIVASAPVRFDGEPAIQTVATDITDLKEREAELERQVQRLEEFASIVSHDLRNPLNVAIGRLELAMEGTEDEHLDRAAAALDRMEVLIDDLLALARHGQTVTDAEPVELALTARHCWNTVTTDSAVLDIDSAAVVLADESRLRQVLENLVGNAVEHAGPDVTVRVGDLDDGFYVEDDGPGIPAERRETVFETGHSTKADGGGFGLAIVEQIAAAHDWDVRVTEGTDGGARFEFTGVEFA